MKILHITGTHQKLFPREKHLVISKTEYCLAS